MYAQTTGSLPFTFELGNLISFSPWSIPSILLLIQLAFNIPWSIYFWLHRFEFYEVACTIFPGFGVSKTEETTGGLILHFLHATETVIRCIIVCNRENILLFYTKFNTALSKATTSVLDTSVKPEISNHSSAKSRKLLMDTLAGNRKCMRVIWGSLLLVQTAALSFPFVMLFMDVQINPSLGISCIPKLVLIICLLINAVTNVIFAVFPLWLISILIVIKFLFSKLTLKLMDITDVGNDTLSFWRQEVRLSNEVVRLREEVLTDFIEKYRDLEELVECFNETFKYPLIILLGFTCGIFTTHCFSLIATATGGSGKILDSQEFVRILVYLAPLMLIEGGVVFALCAASGDISDEVRKN
jgi:hypothetical protein